MSNLLFMDESNGNGVYATTVTAATATTTTILINNTNINNQNNNHQQHRSINDNDNNNNDNGIGNTLSNSHSFNNNINNIMAAASNASSCPSGSSVVQQLPASLSNEDLSQSLSEYTDADESISAPTEFLAEFLSSVMLKDYKKALKYCKLILQYEPHNSTAKEFYPLILDKLRGATSSDSDENYNKSSSSPEFIMEAPSSDPSAGESDDHEALPGDERHCRQPKISPQLHDVAGAAAGRAVDPNSNLSSNSNSIEDVDDDADADEEEDGDDGGQGESSSGSVGGSLSDSIDVDEGEEDEDCEDDDDDDDDEDEDEDDEDEDEDEDEDDIMSSSGDDLPVDEQQIIVGDILDLDNSGNACGDAAHNGSNSSRNSSSGGKISSRSDNTTHSYSSLLLEEEDDLVPPNLQFPREFNTPDLDVSNGNKIPSASCSDSESPTEPLTQRLAAILRSKCGVSNTNC